MSDDECPHCGATALESADCALNGCPFGRYEEAHMKRETAAQKLLRERAEARNTHRSDCAIYNAPAKEAGPCDCGAKAAPPARREEV